MATVNLGSIKFKWKGTYAGGTAYTIDDVVSYNGSSYICIQASTGNLPTNATYFEQMSSAGTNGTDGTDLTTTLTTQGDILFRDGSGLQRLAIGTAGQILKVNSGATALEYGADEGGKILQVIHSTSTSGTTVSTNGTWTDISGSTISITPSSTSSRIIHIFDSGGYASDNASGCFLKVLRGTTQVRQVEAGRHNNTNEETMVCKSISLDSPSTTSSITYKVQALKDGGNNFFINAAGVAGGIQNFLIEVA
jgi:hypothetical protein